MRSYAQLLIVLCSAALLFPTHINGADHDEAVLSSPELAAMMRLWQDDGKGMDLDTTMLEYRYFQNREYLQYQFIEEKRNREEWQAVQDILKSESEKYNENEPLVIPVVFHALHSEDTEKIEEEIKYQLEALNRDFGKPVIPEKDIYDPEGKFAASSAAPNISFVAADLADEITGVGGVAKIVDATKNWEDYDAMKAPILGSPPVDPERNINVWITKSDDRIGSYASTPSGPPEIDGIVIDQRYFGRGSDVYTEGKTLTHLIGNYLGLHDLWGYYRCQDDGVEDTPIHNAPTIGEPRAKRNSTCEGLPRAMMMNFMDSTDDKFQYMFTKGQVQRMRYVLSPEGPRANLVKTQ